jgi:muramoyltetrapeptide carboxypeptidase
MIRPPYLKSGDKIAIVAPARFITKKELKPAIELFSDWGYKVVEVDGLYEMYHQFAGTDRERAGSMQQALDDESIRAVFFARGGYGCLRTLMHLNWDGFMRAPKWLIGYSDITVFHSYVNQVLGVETIHGPMPIKFSKTPDNILSRLHDALQGQSLVYRFKAHPFNKKGTAKGILIGGNLSILYSLRGTEADIKTDNTILFIEDLDEYLYHIDRMMMNFRYGNVLQNLKAVVVGGMEDMHDNQVPFGSNAEEIIASSLQDLNYPVIFGFNAGHIEQNNPIYLGREITIDAGDDDVTIRF